MTCSIALIKSERVSSDEMYTTVTTDCVLTGFDAFKIQCNMK